MVVPPRRRRAPASSHPYSSPPPSSSSPSSISSKKIGTIIVLPIRPPDIAIAVDLQPYRPTRCCVVVSHTSGPYIVFSNTYTPPPSHTPTGGEDDYSHTDGCDGGTAAAVVVVPAAAYNNNSGRRRLSGVVVAGGEVSAANYCYYEPHDEE